MVERTAPAFLPAFAPWPQNAVATHTFDRLYAFVWWRIITWVKYRQRPQRLATDRLGWGRDVRHLHRDDHPLPVAWNPVPSPWPTAIIEPTA
jgi:hypothetical protein